MVRSPARSTSSGGRSAAGSTRRSSAILQAVGQQAGTLLRSARLHAATERQARQATKLYEVAGQLASSFDLDRVLDRVAETTLDLLGCDASGIYAYDEARGGLVLRRGLHLDPELSRTSCSSRGKASRAAPSSSAARCGRGTVKPTPRSQYTPATEALVRAKAPRAYLAVPVASGDAGSRRAHLPLPRAA